MKKVSADELFRPSQKGNLKKMLRAELLQNQFNRTPLWMIPVRNFFFKRLIGEVDSDPLSVNSTFRVAYGFFIHIGKNFYSNYDCTILDHTDVWIGDDVFLAPNVLITTISHPIHAQDRVTTKSDMSFEPGKRICWETVKPIHIGDRVWLASGVIVCSGVPIGENSVIGAGSVVTRDIPPNVFACGVPCRVVREITEADRIDFSAYEKDEQP